MEHLAGDVRAEAVRQVAARVERHAEQPLVAEAVAQRLPVLLAEVRDAPDAELGQCGRLDAVREDGPVGGQVGVDAGVRLHVGVLGAEQFTGVLGGDGLDGVDVLAAGVEAVADGALGVLVAQPGAHGREYRQAGVVLGRDELQRRALVGEFLTRRGGDAGLHLLDHAQKGPVGRRDRLEIAHNSPLAAGCGSQSSPRRVCGRSMDAAPEQVRPWDVDAPSSTLTAWHSPDAPPSPCSPSPA